MYVNMDFTFSDLGETTESIKMDLTVQVPASLHAYCLVYLLASHCDGERVKIS